MFRSSSNRPTDGYAGYMTFHRVDPCLIKSQSVGIPWRLVMLVLGAVFLVAAGYGSVEVLQADTVMDHAVQLLSGGEGIPLRLAPDLNPTL